MPQLGNLQLGASEIGAPPGGGSTNIALRGTQQQFGTASSGSIAFPTGSIAGDFAVLFLGGGFTPGTPTGWTPLAGPTNQANWNSGVWTKTLTSADIITGSVSFGWSGGFDWVAEIATFAFGSPLSASATFTDNSSGSTSIVLGWSGAALANDIALYFASNRATSTDTVSRGTSQQAGTNSGSASGCLYAETLATDTTSLAAAFNYSSAGSGNAQAIVVISAAPPLSNAQVSELGISAIVAAPPPNAYVTELGITVIVPRVALTNVRAFLQIIT